MDIPRVPTKIDPKSYTVKEQKKGKLFKKPLWGPKVVDVEDPILKEYNMYCSNNHFFKFGNGYYSVVVEKTVNETYNKWVFHGKVLYKDAKNPDMCAFIIVPISEIYDAFTKKHDYYNVLRDHIAEDIQSYFEVNEEDRQTEEYYNWFEKTLEHYLAQSATPPCKKKNTKAFSTALEEFRSHYVEFYEPEYFEDDMYYEYEYGGNGDESITLDEAVETAKDYLLGTYDNRELEMGALQLICFPTNVDPTAQSLREFYNYFTKQVKKWTKKVDKYILQESDDIKIKQYILCILFEFFSLANFTHLTRKDASEAARKYIIEETRKSAVLTFGSDFEDKLKSSVEESSGNNEKAGGARTQHVRTSTKVDTQHGVRNIYEGKRGGKYIKVKGQFVPYKL